MAVAVAVMGHHCCSKQKVKRGLWSPEEDQKLIRYITTNGHGCWSSVPKQAGLQRCGKSCRLRWINYLRPELKRGSFSTEEERIIIDVHRIVGNRWAQIAKHLPGRTDNEVKNFWNSCIKKKLIAQGLDPKTHNLLPSSRPPNTINGCNLSQFPHHPQPSSTPFTISSNIRRFDTIKGNSVDMSPPFVTISPAPAPAPAPPNIPLHETMTFPNFQYQDPNVLMSFNNQSSHSSVEFPNCSSSLEHSHISPSFDQPSFMDETCLWPGTLDILEDPKQNELEPHQGLELGQEQSQNVVPKMDFNEANEEKGVHTDASYNSAVFDLELMESALIPYGVFCNGSSMEQLQWEC